MRTIRLAIACYFLPPDQRRVIEQLNAPDRWMPELKVEASEARAWGEILRTQAGLKIDVAMINLGQQEAQRVLTMPPADVIRQAGFAAGFRHAWTMAKALSTLTGAEAGATEGDGDTARSALDNLAP